MDELYKGTGHDHDPSQQEIYQQMQRRLQALSERLSALNEIIGILNRGDIEPSQGVRAGNFTVASADHILRLLRRHVRRILPYDHLSVCLPITSNFAVPDDPPSANPRRPAETVIDDRDDAPIPENWVIRPLDGIWAAQTIINIEEQNTLALALRVQKPVHIASGRESAVFAGMESQIIVPFIIGGRILGALNIAHRDIGIYTEDDLHIAELLATQVASALQRAEQMRALQGAQDVLQAYADQLVIQRDELEWFSAIAAHDLKAPLGVIVGYSSLLQSIAIERDDPDFTRYSTEILNATGNMNTMIERLLELAHMWRGTPPHEVDVNEAAHRAIGRFQHTMDERTIAGERIPIILDAQLDAPPALGYAAWIEEVFANLIGNAIKYIGDKNPSPHITVRTLDADKMVRCEVRDNGMGIDEAHLDRVWQMFDRAQATGEGHGLGLFIVLRLVRELGGRVGVESKRGEGSLFWFTIPRTKDPIPIFDESAIFWLNPV